MRDFSSFLTTEIKDFMFSSLDSDFLVSNGLGFMENVPFPIKKNDLTSLINNGISTAVFADNMAIVCGADSGFKYSPYYIQFISKLFDDKIILVLCGQGEKMLEKHRYRRAICYLRTALQLKSESKEALYCYANACRIFYQSMEGEYDTALIQMLKDEANEYFALTTSEYPDFAPAWYFLGYAYLNAGSYIKAQLAFKHYLLCSEGKGDDEIKEVQERIDELKDPVIIEQGKNYAVAGQFNEALKLLEPFVGGKYDSWWPLHYYLAVVYENLDMLPEAAEGYRKVLSLNPSNYDASKALSDIYLCLGDSANAEKYRKKAELLSEN